eukprot:6202572-Pleurochrysis_carterae.AAC.6
MRPLWETGRPVRACEHGGGCVMKGVTKSVINGMIAVAAVAVFVVAVMVVMMLASALETNRE